MGAIPVSTEKLDVLVIGGGFAGVLHLYKLREAGYKVKLFEAAKGFGGIWRNNSYPDARVDSELPIYGLDLEPVWRSWNWSRRYPGFKELREYFAHMDKVLDLSKDCTFDMRVHAAQWSDTEKHWKVTAGNKDSPTVVTAQHVVFCLGFASALNWPDVPGREDFKGDLYHSGQWPDGLEAKDLAGKRVAIIGSGASGVQCTQGIGPHAKEMSVFIRTPNLCLPMHNNEMTVESQEAFKDVYHDIFEKRYKTFGGFQYDFDYEDWARHTPEEREAFYERIWARGGFHFWLETYVDVYFKADCNKTAYDFWQKKVSKEIKDPKKRAILAPEKQPHTFGTVRPSLQSNYYKVLDQDNVDVIHVKENPIERFTEKGIRLKNGEEKEFDFIVLATGFDTHTGGFKKINITGENGLPLSKKWGDGCNSYLGLTTQGFPNLFFLYGPHGPTAYTNGPSTVEVQTRWVVAMIEHMKKENYRYFRTEKKAEDDFTQRIDDLSAATLFHTTHSWYMGRNVKGKKAQALNFTGGLPAYAQDLEDSSSNNYKGFELIKSSA